LYVKSAKGFATRKSGNANASGGLRTPRINPGFEHNLLITNEKRLLFVGNLLRNPTDSQPAERGIIFNDPQVGAKINLLPVRYRSLVIFVCGVNRNLLEHPDGILEVVKEIAENEK
jgi:hypothetical protein